MRLPQKKDKNPKLTKAKDVLLDKLVTLDPTDPEYPKTIVYLQRLNDLDPKKDKKSVSPDAIVGLIGTLGSVLLVVAYEQKHVFATQAKMFFPKMK